MFQVRLMLDITANLGGGVYSDMKQTCRVLLVDRVQQQSLAFFIAQPEKINQIYRAKQELS